MKRLFPFLLVLVFSCNKNTHISEYITGPAIKSENGVFPLPCHSSTFSTNYAVQAGKVPPFRFTKTHYASGRVRTINMLSRANPIHAAFKPRAWEVIGTFTYDLKSQAYFVGTKQLWEYYKTSTGAAARRSIVKKNVSLTFHFHPIAEPESEGAFFTGSCFKVYNNLEGRYALQVWAFPSIEVLAGSDEPEANYEVDWSDENALVIYSYQPPNYMSNKKITFKYKPGVTGKTLSYQPTQNWISLEYSLVEVMQWLGPLYGPDRERTSVAVEFYPYNTPTKVVQSQVYKNHKYDAKNNLLSYTYGDNVLQKTTWLCK